jgi:hypothetical protein
MKANSGRKNADDALVLALACGATIESAASKAGVCARTAHRRLKDPEFVKRLDDLRADMLKRATAMLTAAAMEAVKTLVALQAATIAPGVRLGAARATLEMGAKYRETAELAQRIAVLEREWQNR